MGLAVLALVGLYLFGQAGRTAPPPRDEPGLEEESPGGEITLIGEDFDFTHSEGEQPVFRIRGESVRADRGGTVYLDGVGLTLYDEEGEAYDVAADRAAFHREDREARLAGDVVLSGPDNTRLETRGLRLVQRGRVLVSTGPVRFTYSQLEGRADTLRIDRRDDSYVLAGEVRVTTLPDAEENASLECRRLVFERERHQIYAQGDAVLVRRGDRIQANRINAFFDDADRTLLFVRARFNVRGRLAVADPDAAPAAATAAGPGAGADASEGPGREISFRGRSLSLLQDPAGRPRNAELEGAPGEPVVVESPTDAGTVHRLVAGYFVGSFENGILANVRAYNEPRLLEVDPRVPGDGELRRLEGRRLEGAFTADGRLVSLAALEEVRYRDEEVRAEGDEGEFDVLADKGEFRGDPVRLESDRGELLAPRVTYERDIGLVYAQGGVRALARDASEAGLSGTPLGSGEGPVRIESEEAFWRDDPRSALFRGDVRAWRGENLLLAQAMRADREGGAESLTASGGVRTVWIPRPATGGEAAPEAEAGHRAPVEVTANTLNYEPADDLLIYEGRVRAEQTGRVLTCQRLEVELDQEGSAERLICMQTVHLDDRTAGNSADGDRAVYDLAARTVTMTGGPVTLEKSDGATVQGGRVVYDLTTGTARVVGEARPPAPGTAEGEPEGGESGEAATGDRSGAAPGEREESGGSGSSEGGGSGAAETAAPVTGGDAPG